MTIARRRPIASDQMPKPIPPTIAPTLPIIASSADGVRVEVVLLLEEGRVEILRAVAEEVERGHQHDQVERDLPVRAITANGLTWRLSRRASNAGLSSTCMPDQEDQDRRRDPDHEHAAPADRVEQQEIDQAGDEIARRDSPTGAARRPAPRSFAGIDSITRLAPIPHSPPMQKPNSVRITNRLVRLRAKAGQRTRRPRRAGSRPS